jgi:hypothetical protein
MWPYWLVFLVPALIALALPRRRRFEISGEHANVHDSNLAWTSVAIGIAAFIGYRVEVGGDWYSYIGYLGLASHFDLWSLLTLGDPGYMLLNWLSSELGWGIIGVNLMAAAIFTIGLAKFCRAQPYPWLALAVSVPYLVIVLGMGYTRQGIALGLALLGLLSLRGRSTIWFVFWVLLGATFHKTAVLLLPIAAIANTENRIWTALWTAIVSISAYYLLLEESVDSLYANYVEAEYQSEGAFVRLLMNAVPGILLIAWLPRFRFSKQEATLWSWIAVLSLALFAAYFIFPSSTAIDRFALYLLPIQIVVFSRLPIVLGKENGGEKVWVVLVLMYFMSVQFVWLNFASHAPAWLPYRFYLLEMIS